MNSILLYPLILSGFGIALAHASMPTHWLPFVIAGKQQNWNRRKTLTLLATAGLFHVLVTTLLGAGIVFFGVELQEHFGPVLPFVAGGILIFIGLRYLLKTRKVHDCSHCPVDTETKITPASGRKFVWSLVGMLTLSPCESFLPVYLSGVAFGWSAFLILSGVLALATIAAMVGFAWLGTVALDKVNSEIIQKYDRFIYGGLFCVLGILMIISETGH